MNIEVYQIYFPLQSNRITNFSFTIVTGFLGAGKTILLNNLLCYKNKNQIKFAVIVNKYAELR